MKELSKQEVEVVLAGKAMPGELLVGESLAKYFARLYLATKESRDAQIAALTAESVALKNYIIKECFIVEEGRGCLAEADTCASERMPSSPATDAAANALRAEGAASVGTLIRACAHEFPSHVDDIVEECAMIADNAAIKLSEGKC